VEEWSRSVQLLMSCSLAISTRSLSDGVSLLLSFSFSRDMRGKRVLA